MDSFELLRLDLAEEDPQGQGPPQHAEADWAVRPDRLGGVWGYTRSTPEAGWLHLPGIALYEFVPGSARVKARRDPGATDEVVVDAFYRHALPMGLDFHGFQVLHASAVRGERGVHVFCGASQSGKSTVAYALGRRGYDVWADDAVVFRVAGGTVVAVPVPFAVRLREEAAGFFGRAGPGSAAGNGKVEALRYLAVEPLPLASVSVLERGQERIEPLPPSESFPTLLGQGFYFCPEDEAARRRTVGAFLTLIARTRVFRVVLPSELGRLEGVLDAIEADVLTGRPPAAT